MRLRCLPQVLHSCTLPCSYLISVLRLFVLFIACFLLWLLYFVDQIVGVRFDTAQFSLFSASPCSLFHKYIFIPLIWRALQFELVFNLIFLCFAS